MSLNTVCLMGRLTADPERRETANGTVVTTFGLAVDRAFAAKGEERKADFITVVAWRQTAEFVCKYFGKGDMIALRGRIQTRRYQDKEGNNRTAFEVVADEVAFCGSKAGQDRTSKERPAPDYGGTGGFQDIDIDPDDLPF